MAFLLIAVVVVAKTNPQLIEDFKRKYSNKDETTLLRTKTRSEAQSRGDLEVSVMSVKGLVGNSLTDSDSLRGSRRKSKDGWVIDDTEDATDRHDLVTDAKAEMRRDSDGRVGEAVGGQQQKMGILEQKLKFPIFEDQPEMLQLFLYVRRKNDPLRTRHLAVANVPASRATEIGSNLTPCSLTLQSSGERIGSVQVSIQYQPTKVDIYGDSQGYSFKGPASKNPKMSRVMAPLSKVGGRLGSMVGKFPGFRKKYSVWDEKYAEEDEGFSAFL